LILSQEDFPVSPSVSQGEGERRQTRGGCGPSSCELFAAYDRLGYLWKMFQGSLIVGLRPFCETWPAAGMMRSGRLYQRVRWGHHRCGRDCSFWPTLVASEYSRGHTTRYAQGGRSLSYALGGKPSPMWSEWLMGFPLGWTELEG
jgi:hypothetical protein